MVSPEIIVNHRTGNYPIYIGIGVQNDCLDILRERIAPSSNHLWITDANVNALYGNAFGQSAFDHTKLICDPGETSKSFTQYHAALNHALDLGLDRHSTIFALGGGVPGDLAGFVAASFMRGINWIQIPTTLLAQVDSSVGGKTGINLSDAKNSVGAFWQPQAVIIDPSVLKTLELSELTSGLAEVVKYGVIMDVDFFGWLESNCDSINHLDMEVMTHLIRRCCQLKAHVVQEDEYETNGKRAILNYGHTFAHAIEKVFGYGTYPHGHAVAMGMQAAMRLAELLGRVPSNDVMRQAKLLQNLKIPHLFPAQHHTDLWDAMARDKKAIAGKRRFILPTRIGHVELVDSIAREVVLESMELASRPMA